MALPPKCSPLLDEPMGFGRRPISRTLLEEADMKITSRVFSGTLAALAMVAVTAGPVRAVDIGEPAPDFRLPSTFGRDISLGEYRGKQWVLIEFYGADFAPT
jgi:hypothetical protein